MKVSIIIRAYNEARHIERLLIGIDAQTVSPHEVILVDSGSTDDTVAIAQVYGARIVEIDKAEFTFGRALNRGCANATGDICVFASGHVYPVYDTWLEKLIEPLRDERVVLSYGRQKGNHINKFSEHQVFAQCFPSESICPQASYFCNNANCAIRRSIWEIHPYDESLTGLEDLAWAKVVQARGGWIAYVAEAEIVHVHDEPWEQIFNRYRREAMAMRRIDEHARFTLSDFIWLMARNVWSDMHTALQKGVFLKTLWSIVMFRCHQLSGTYCGYRGPSEASAELRARFYYPAGIGMRHGQPHEHAASMIDYAQLEAKVRHRRAYHKRDHTQEKTRGSDDFRKGIAVGTWMHAANEE